MIYFLLPELRERLFANERKYKVRETSYSGLRPGDLIQFDYMGSSRYGYVLASKKTTSGLFTSLKGTRLSNVLDIGGLDEGDFTQLLNNIYNNESKADYQDLKKSGFLDDTKKFRTFRLMGLRNILKVYLDLEDE